PSVKRHGSRGGLRLRPPATRRSARLSSSGPRAQGREADVQGSKPWWMSKTVWGNLISAGAVAYTAIAGVELSEAVKGDLEAVSVAITFVIGLAWNLIGRAKAQQKLTIK